MTAVTVLVYLYFILRICFRKPRKGVLDEHYGTTSLFFDTSFLENLQISAEALYCQ